MKRFIPRWILPALLCVLLTGCQEETPGKSAEELRIEREVEKRLAAGRLQLETRAQRLRTLRIVGLVLLSGGALAGLVWFGWPQYRQQWRNPSATTNESRPSYSIRHPLRGGRVLDLRSPPLPSRSGHETPRRP